MFGEKELLKNGPTPDVVELSDDALESAAGGYTIERIEGGGGIEGDSFVVHYRNSASGSISQEFNDFDALYEFIDWEMRAKGHAYGADD